MPSSPSQTYALHTPFWGDSGDSQLEIRLDSLIQKSSEVVASFNMLSASVVRNQPGIGSWQPGRDSGWGMTPSQGWDREERNQFQYVFCFRCTHLWQFPSHVQAPWPLLIANMCLQLLVQLFVHLTLLYTCFCWGNMVASTLGLALAIGCKCIRVLSLCSGCRSPQLSSTIWQQTQQLDLLDMSDIWNSLNKCSFQNPGTSSRRGALSMDSVLGRGRYRYSQRSSGIHLKIDCSENSLKRMQCYISYVRTCASMLWLDYLAFWTASFGVHSDQAVPSVFWPRRSLLKVFHSNQSPNLNSQHHTSCDLWHWQSPIHFVLLVNETLNGIPWIEILGCF